MSIKDKILNALNEAKKKKDFSANSYRKDGSKGNLSYTVYNSGDDGSGKDGKSIVYSLHTENSGGFHNYVRGDYPDGESTFFDLTFLLAGERLASARLPSRKSGLNKSFRSILDGFSDIDYKVSSPEKILIKKSLNDFIKGLEYVDWGKN